MPLTPCNDCEREISPTARVCPFCGRLRITDPHPVGAGICSLIIPGAGNMYRGDVLIGVMEFLVVAFFYFFAVITRGVLLPLAAFVHGLVIIHAIVSDPVR